MNHRGLDLKIRSSEPDAYCDAEIARAVRAAVERGAVTVQIRDESAAGSAGLDEARVKALHQVLERLRQELEIEEPVTLATVGAFWEASRGAGLSGEALWEALRPAVAAALEELGAMRAREGAALAADLGGAAGAARRALAPACGRGRRRCPSGSPSGSRSGSGRRDAQAGRGIDPARLAQEVALMAERLDVAEELVRLETHLGHLAEILKAGGAVGRKLDFVIQEIGRELNTIASKAQDAEMAALVIDAKAELEKLREQAQNVE